MPRVRVELCAKFRSGAIISIGKIRSADFPRNSMTVQSALRYCGELSENKRKEREAIACGAQKMRVVEVQSTSKLLYINFAIGNS